MLCTIRHSPAEWWWWLYSVLQQKASLLNLFLHLGEHFQVFWLVIKPSNNLIWILGLWKGLTITKYLLLITYWRTQGEGGCPLTTNSATLVRENFSEVFFEPCHVVCTYLNSKREAAPPCSCHFGPTLVPVVLSAGRRPPYILSSNSLIVFPGVNFSGPLQQFLETIIWYISGLSENWNVGWYLGRGIHLEHRAPVGTNRDFQLLKAGVFYVSNNNICCL